MHKKGILLINLGTPSGCDPKSVRRYLKEFLNDPRVVDLPGLCRWILVNLLVVPFRYKKTAAAYQKIWTTAGSPLLVHSVNLKNALAKKLGEGYQVELGMRYGHPDIELALEKLRDCNSIFVIPLFPQYSSAATGSAIEKVLDVIKRKWDIPEIKIKNHFYDDPDFIAAYAKNIQGQNIEHLVLSYHGLPERQVLKSSENYNYRTQCYKTSELLARQLNLTAEQYTVSFQSRLGRTPWIKPYTDELLPQLRERGIKNITVACPSFVADCLETLEEVNIRLREQWHKLGGQEFIFVPCLNNNADWVTALAAWCQA